MVKIVKSLARVVNFQIIIHGFNRIGVYPLSAEKCLSNCDESVLKQFDAEMIEEIIYKIPGLVEHLLDESNGGQVTEQVMDEVGIPSIERDDRRTTPKDQRTQNQQRAVMLNHPAARKRRKEWLSTKKMREEQKKDKRGDTCGDEAPGTKRKRAPNRPKEVISEEKRQKEQRKVARSSLST